MHPPEEVVSDNSSESGNADATPVNEFFAHLEEVKIEPDEKTSSFSLRLDSLPAPADDTMIRKSSHNFCEK